MLRRTTNKKHSVEEILKLLPKTREGDLCKLNPEAHKLVMLLANGGDPYAVLDEAIVYLSEMDSHKSIYKRLDRLEKKWTNNQE